MRNEACLYELIRDHQRQKMFLHPKTLSLFILFNRDRQRQKMFLHPKTFSLFILFSLYYISVCCFDTFIMIQCIILFIVFILYFYMDMTR